MPRCIYGPNVGRAGTVCNAGKAGQVKGNVFPGGGYLIIYLVQRFAAAAVRYRAGISQGADRGRIGRAAAGRVRTGCQDKGKKKGGNGKSGNPTGYLKYSP
jgi:hypothetical protein